MLHLVDALLQVAERRVRMGLGVFREFRGHNT